MNFTEFLTTIFNSFNTFFTHITGFINILINDNFIKLIIYISIFGFAIYILKELFSILYTILNNNHDKEEQKKILHPEESKKSNSKNKNGDNFRKKDIYW